MKKKRLLLIVLLIVLIITGVIVLITLLKKDKQKIEDVEEVEVVIPMKYGIPLEGWTLYVDTVRKGDYLGTILVVTALLRSK
jgi:cbb3-type cytochrome oxidase cytochrome c subunit